MSRARLLALVAGLIVMAAGTLGPDDANAATVTATIDLSDQRMYVSLGKKHIHTWPVSTARKGYRTPTGSFRPTRMYRRYYSRKYNNSPMPNSIFFYGGYAIHGTTAVNSLGRPASHGCIRLHPSNAKALYDLVNANGPGNTRIRIRW